MRWVLDTARLERCKRLQLDAKLPGTVKAQAKTDSHRLKMFLHEWWVLVDPVVFMNRGGKKGARLMANNKLVSCEFWDQSATVTHLLSLSAWTHLCKIFTLSQQVLKTCCLRVKTKRGRTVGKLLLLHHSRHLITSGVTELATLLSLKLYLYFCVKSSSHFPWNVSARCRDADRNNCDWFTCQ